MISSLSDSRRPPNLIDGLVFYGADTIGFALQDYAEKELRSRRTDWGTVFLSALGLVVTESIKAGVNQSIRPPFTSLRSTEDGRRYRRRRP